MRPDVRAREGCRFILYSLPRIVAMSGQGGRDDLAEGYRDLSVAAGWLNDKTFDRAAYRISGADTRAHACTRALMPVHMCTCVYVRAR